MSSGSDHGTIPLLTIRWRHEIGWAGQNGRNPRLNSVRWTSWSIRLVLVREDLTWRSCERWAALDQTPSGKMLRWKNIDLYFVHKWIWARNWRCSGRLIDQPCRTWSCSQLSRDDRFNGISFGWWSIASNEDGSSDCTDWACHAMPFTEMKKIH